MDRFTLALGLLIATAATVPAHAADAVATPGPAGQGVVVKRTTEVTVPSAAAASAVKRSARRTSAAAQRTARRARHELHEATRPMPAGTRTEKTTTTVDPGTGASPVVVTKEKKTTN